MHSKFRNIVLGNVDARIEKMTFAIMEKTIHGVYVDRPNQTGDNLLKNSNGDPVPFLIIRGKKWKNIHSVRISIPSILHISKLYGVSAFDYIDDIEKLITRQLRTMPQLGIEETLGV